MLASIDVVQATPVLKESTMLATKYPVRLHIVLPKARHIPTPNSNSIPTEAA